MFIAKIITSNSHVDYAARVLDSLEVRDTPEISDYQFGSFVKIQLKDKSVIGVIYNSKLMNPEYGNFGPRLSTPPELNAVFSPDYLNEQGILIGILLLGSKNADGTHQGIPLEVLPINSEVVTMDKDEVHAFHHDSSGKLLLNYYSHITTHAGSFAFQLLTEIIHQLDQLTSADQRAQLGVLRKTLAWQQTIGKTF